MSFTRDIMVVTGFMFVSPGSSWLLMSVCGTLSASTHSMFWVQASLTELWSAWLSPSRYGKT